ncbi:MAG: 3D domain-containing protein [Staphylococcus sp.]|nr:3D domain-containing protein [Staphylococcus sp.]
MKIFYRICKVLFIAWFLCALFGLHFYYHKAKEKDNLKAEKPNNIVTITSIFDLSQPEYTKRVLKNITVTSYNNHENQTDSTPNVTATNRPIREGIVAASRDLFKSGQVHYGDLIYIDCFDKWYVVEDTMNQRFEKRLDLFLFDKKESLKINKKCSIEVIHYTR